MKMGPVGAELFHAEGRVVNCKVRLDEVANAP
jgi:hypothetical protein